MVGPQVHLVDPVWPEEEEKEKNHKLRKYSDLFKLPKHSVVFCCFTLHLLLLFSVSSNNKKTDNKHFAVSCLGRRASP